MKHSYLALVVVSISLFLGAQLRAEAFMESDPAVVAGLMTAELHSFGVVLKR